MSEGLTYSELAGESLKAGSMENGLQSTAIYWEGWQTSFRGLFAGLYGSKWSWKVVDDGWRRTFGVDGGDVKKHDNYIFYGERDYVREYDGDSDIYRIVPSRKKYSFSFFPTGTKTIGEA